MPPERSSIHPLTLDLAIDREPLRVQSNDLVLEVIEKMSQAQGSNCDLPSASPQAPADLLSTAPLPPVRQRRSSVALVMAGEQLIGIFTERDLVKLAAAAVPLASAKIDDVMTRDVITLQAEADQDIFTARTYFRQHKIRHLPIVDSQRQLLGVITSESIRQALQPLYFMSLKRVADVMISEVLHAPLTTSVRSLAQLMVDRRVSCVVITDRQASGDAPAHTVKPVGIVTERDIV